MDGCLLQDWITISGSPGIGAIAQSATEYLDIGHHEDLVFYLDVRSVTAGVTMNYETAPNKDAGSFLPMVGPFPLATGLRVNRALFATAAVPPARFVRWQCFGDTWSVTFRIWLATYAFASPFAAPVQCQPCGGR